MFISVLFRYMLIRLAKKRFCSSALCSASKYTRGEDLLLWLYKIGDSQQDVQPVCWYYQPIIGEKALLIIGDSPNMIPLIEYYPIIEKHNRITKQVIIGASQKNTQGTVSNREETSLPLLHQQMDCLGKKPKCL